MRAPQTATCCRQGCAAAWEVFRNWSQNASRIKLDIISALCLSRVALALLPHETGADCARHAHAAAEPWHPLAGTCPDTPHAPTPEDRLRRQSEPPTVPKPGAGLPVFTRSR